MLDRQKSATPALLQLWRLPLTDSCLYSCTAAAKNNFKTNIFSPLSHQFSLLYYLFLLYIALCLRLEMSWFLSAISPLPEQSVFFCFLKNVLVNASVLLFAGWLLFHTPSPNNGSTEHSLALQVTTNLRQTLWKHHFVLSLAGRTIAPLHHSTENYCCCLLHLMNFLQQL